MPVLGKRSRSTRQNPVADIISQDVESLPPRKRSKRSVPLIHEDADATPSSLPASRRPLKSCRGKQAFTPDSQQSKVVHEDLELPDASIDASERDENLPPVETFLATPSKSRFKNVRESSPLTPKHKVRVIGGLLTPRTPRTQSATREHNIYARARQLFTSSAAPAKLVGREKERQQLHQFIEGAENKIGGQCIYISGPPGTGKSALIHEVLQQHGSQAIRIATINCVGLRTAAQVYGRLVEDLAPEQNNGKSPEQLLGKLFTASSGPTAYVVMLDEIDSLVETECDVLYKLFEWSLKPGSNLSLIGVANSLDLTDRFLPRLKSKGLKPRLLPFLPYNAQQIAQIISDKLRTLLPEGNTTPTSFTPCIHPAAIQLCAKKIASQTGDLRKAFNLVRRSLDVIETDATKSSTPTKQPLGEITNTTQLFQAQLHTTKTPVFTAESAPRASIAHVAKLAASIFNQGTTSRLSGLNLQQKAVLCSVVSKEVQRQARNPFITPTKSANKAPTVAELFQKYTSLCKRDDGLLQPLKDTEFRDVVASLETLGLVHESKARSSSLLTPTSSRSGKNHDERQIVSAVTDKEMRDSLQGPGADLLRRLLEEV